MALNTTPITTVLEELGLTPNLYELYGSQIAKLNFEVLKLPSNTLGQLVLVSAITPTAQGEGKSTISIGLSQALNRLGKRSIVALREPSMGPVFGRKGGATGGGKATLVPSQKINLHFTGDIHAVSSATNLLCALIDHHLKVGNALKIDVAQIQVKRVIDINDRALRNITIGQGSFEANGPTRTEHFQLTVASEIMAILALSSSVKDLKSRLNRMVVAFSLNNEPISVAQLEATSALAALLVEALKPNLVQTSEGSPALVHTGPFANIAHGCSSLIATQMALKLCDYTVTEAGFATELGLEKFFNIKAPTGRLTVDAVVLIVTLRALKAQGQGTLGEASFAHLLKHLANIEAHNAPAVVAINLFAGDDEADLATLTQFLSQNNIAYAPVSAFTDGGAGALALAEQVVALCQRPAVAPSQQLYSPEMSLKAKIARIGLLYNANAVAFSAEAEATCARYEAEGFGHLAICIAKTPTSLGTTKNELGVPKPFTLTISKLKLAAGAGFVVAFTDSVLDLPGLPQNLSLTQWQLDDDGTLSNCGF